MATKHINCSEYILKTLRNADLCPDVDFNLSFHRGSRRLDIYVFWHQPSLNLGWYPICQIDSNDRTVFWREGSENDEHWNDLLKETADFLERYNKA